MTNSNTTTWTLVSSVLTIVMCVAMLVGTTYAWFTSTAKTGVNKIQSGTLQVDIVDESGASLNGSTLNWVKADGTEEVLWEPGAEYALTPFKVVNKGTMAFKYKVTISGATGDTQLLDVIDFTLKTADGTTYDLNGWEGVLLPAGKTATDGEEVGETGLITLSGKMRTDAGNEYQGLTVDGISITVVALQNVDEAEFPVTVGEIRKKYGVDGLKMPAGVVIEDLGRLDASNGGHFNITLNDKESFLYFTQVFNREAAFEARKAGLDNGTITKYEGEFNGSSLNMWYGPYCHKITFIMDCDVDLDGIYVNPFGFDGYLVNFNGNGHTIKNAKLEATSGQLGLFTTKVVVSNLVLDNIQVTATGCDSAGVVAGSPNTTLDNITVKNCTVTGAKYTGAICGYNYGGVINCTVENTVVSGQYKVGGILGYICEDERYSVDVTGNKLTNVTVKGENIWSGKTEFVIGKIVGNWNAMKGTCKNNTFSGTTTATNDIGKVEERAEAGLIR